MNTYRKTIFIGVLLLVGGLHGLAQTPTPEVEPSAEAAAWPQSTFSVGLYASTLGDLANPINLTFEKLMLTQRGNRWGFSFGYSMMLGGYVGNRIGAHAALGYVHSLGTEGRHHFELYGGLAYFVWDYFDGAFHTNPLLIPVLAAGYRHQRPGSPGFFRAGLNLGGLALGFGYVLGSKP